MKNKRMIWISAVLVVIVAIIGVMLVVIHKEVSSDEIPDGYIAVFHGGVGEQTYETYIYKVSDEHDSYRFDYINTTSTTKSYGSPDWRKKITKRGSVNGKDDLLKVVEENGANSFVTCPNSNKDFYLYIQFEKCF